MKKPVVLCIMDGYGLRDEVNGNAVKAAKTPNLDKIFNGFPTTNLYASGLPVGLPEGQMGNSEVGHLNLGAGRIVYQSLTQINKAVDDGSFFENEVFLKAINHVTKNDSKLHIWGLLSDGGVHSNFDHIIALIKLAKEKNINKIYVHAFLDGRDVAPDSGSDFVNQLEEKLVELGVGEIASISGRYYAMDRDKRFERVEKAYDVMFKHQGDSFTNPVQYVKDSYAKEVFDEFVLPGYNKSVNGKIEDHDAIIFANFRPDRAIQMASAVTNPDYIWNSDVRPTDIFFVQMMKYADSVIGEAAFKPQPLNNTFGEYLSNIGKTQLRIAETEKYAHVTFFFDAQKDVVYPGATRILVDSPKVATYDLQPEMSANEVTEKLLAELDKNIHDVIIVNYANCDMVGHTGMIDAAVKAVETVDNCVGKIFNKIEEIGGIMLLTADHGNAEMMNDLDGNPFTAHTTSLVPLCITDKNLKLVNHGKLGDIAVTMLELMNEKVPEEMTGISLIEK